MKREKVLGIIGCLALADEMVEVLSSDEEIERAFVVDNEEGRIVADKLWSRAPHLTVTMVHESQLKHSSWPLGLTVIVWMRPSSLHDSPDDLRSGLRTAATALSGCVGSILMFYGLCRSTLRELERIANETEVPVTFLTDLEGEVVDDCFAAVFGGRRRYLEMIKKYKGTLFVTTGYAEHLARRQDGKDLVRMMEEINEYQFLFKTLGYSKLLKLDTGLGDREEFEIRVHNLARIFDFSLERLSCNLEVFWHSYAIARERLEEMASEEAAEEASGQLEQNCP